VATTRKDEVRPWPDETGEQPWPELPSHDTPRQPDQPSPADDMPAATETTGSDDATPDDAPSDDIPAASDIWQRVLPELQALWQRHLERWPEPDQRPADRAGDEPGSWHGDGGQYLSPKDNVVAIQSFERMRTAEKDISPTMRDIEAAIPGAKLVGFDHRLKHEIPFKEKVAAELIDKPQYSVFEIANRVPDTVRYTYTFSSDRYTIGYWAVQHELMGRGCELVMSRNSWSGDEYKGINTRWMTTGGERFEVQFHTPESFEAKQLTHEAYERLRVIKSPSIERPELEDFQRRVTSNVSIPDGAAKIPDKRELI
jgi:hypothetical protein